MKRTKPREVWFCQNLHPTGTKALAKGHLCPCTAFDGRQPNQEPQPLVAALWDGWLVVKYFVLSVHVFKGQTDFFEIRCKGTAFFWHMQIFWHKNTAVFAAFASLKNRKSDIAKYRKSDFAVLGYPSDFVLIFVNTPIIVLCIYRSWIFSSRKYDFGPYKGVFRLGYSFSSRKSAVFLVVNVQFKCWYSVYVWISRYKLDFFGKKFAFGKYIKLTTPGFPVGCG